MHCWYSNGRSAGLKMVLKTLLWSHLGCASAMMPPESADPGRQLTQKKFIAALLRRPHLNLDNASGGETSNGKVRSIQKGR